MNGQWPVLGDVCLLFFLVKFFIGNIGVEDSINITYQKYSAAVLC